jgi:hypothetical protein
LSEVDLLFIKYKVAMSDQITKGRIKSRIGFFDSKMRTLRRNAVEIPVRATSRKLSRSL